MEGQWLRRPESGTAVVFLHGVLSSIETSWQHENGAFWPGLVRDDPGAAGAGIYVFAYRTGIFSGTYRLGDVVDALKEQMRLDGLFDCRTIIFVAHSMGGIVARKLLVSRAADFRERGITVGLFLVASPSLGSGYANFLTHLARLVNHTQADALRFSQANSWLMDLDREFLNLKEAGTLKLAGKEIVEDRFVILSKLIGRQVVEPFSGARYFGEAIKIPDSDHFSIAKPESGEALQHRLLVRFIGEVMEGEILSIEAELEMRLEDRLDGCRKAEVPFRTFHRLDALLAMQSRFAASCLDAAKPGTAARVEAWLAKTIADQPGSEKGLPAFREPKDDPLFEVARTIATRERALEVDERHLLLAILDDAGAGTVVELRRALGEAGFSALDAVARARRPEPYRTQRSNVVPIAP